MNLEKEITSTDTENQDVVIDMENTENETLSTDAEIKKAPVFDKIIAKTKGFFRTVAKYSVNAAMGWAETIAQNRTVGIIWHSFFGILFTFCTIYYALDGGPGKAIFSGIIGIINLGNLGAGIKKRCSDKKQKRLEAEKKKPYKYGIGGAKLKEGVLTIPAEFNDLEAHAVYKLNDLVELNVLGDMKKLYSCQIEGCPNLKRINFSKMAANDYAEFGKCYSLEELTFCGESVPVKVASCGIFGYVKDVTESAPYTIYKVQGRKLATGGDGFKRVYAGTVIDGFEYVGCANADKENPLESATNDIKLRICKHIAPKLFYNDGFYGTNEQKELLYKVSEDLLKSAEIGTGDKTFNNRLHDGNVPKGNPHNLPKDILKQLKAKESARKLWAINEKCEFIY